MIDYKGKYMAVRAEIAQYNKALEFRKHEAKIMRDKLEEFGMNQIEVNKMIMRKENGKRVDSNLDKMKGV